MKYLWIPLGLAALYIIGGAIHSVVSEIRFKRKEERDRLEYPDKTRWNDA